MKEIENLDAEQAMGEESGELPPSTEVAEGEAQVPVEGTELAQFEAAEIEEVEFVAYDQVLSIVESILFASDRPVTLESIRGVFKGTNVRSKDLRRALEDLASKYASPERGVTLDEVGGGYQLRTKLDNAEFMKRHVKGRAFRLSGPALEVLSIVAYKQPTIKAEVDQIRGVESGHLMRALMDRGLIRFGGKSELPGKPMFYETTRKFLEIFGLRNLKELPTLAEIEELLPEGIGEVEEEKKSLGDLTGELSMASASTYSEGEGELLKISDQLTAINTSSEFFEQEKARQKRKRDEEKAQDIREALMLGQEVDPKDLRWLKKYEEGQAPIASPAVEESVELTSEADVVLDVREEVPPEAEA